MFDTFTKKCTRNYTAAYTKLPVKSANKRDISYFRDYLHIEKPKFHGLQKFGNVAKMVEIKLHILE